MILLLFALCFTVGEKLNYVGKFSFLTLGSMTLEIKDTLTYDDAECYHLFSTITSNPALRFLFSLNDTMEVYTKMDNLLPLFYEEKIHEGGYSNHARLSFDHESRSVVYNDSMEHNLLEGSRDLISFWYYLRTIVLDVGDTIPVNIHESEKNYEIACFVEKKERIKSPLGEFNTILVSPQTEGKGIFGSGGGMSIWYSDDDARYPVQIKVKMKIGSAIFKLREVQH
jgi:hypothetical protein